MMLTARLAATAALWLIPAGLVAAGWRRPAGPFLSLAVITAAAAGSVTAAVMGEDLRRSAADDTYEACLAAVQDERAAERQATAAHAPRIHPGGRGGLTVTRLAGPAA